MIIITIVDQSVSQSINQSINQAVSFFLLKLDKPLLNSVELVHERPHVGQPGPHAFYRAAWNADAV